MCTDRHIKKEPRFRNYPPEKPSASFVRFGFMRTQANVPDERIFVLAVDHLRVLVVQEDMGELGGAAFRKQISSEGDFRS